MSAENNLGGQWEQMPLIHTPKELKKIAHGLTDKDHPYLGGEHGATGNLDDPNNNQLTYMGGNKDSAAGECDRACRVAHEFLPPGSHQVIYDDHPKGYNHFVHHVPTTEGMHVVDYTQRQFNAHSKFPVVEPMKTFHNRQSMKQFGTMKTKNINYYRADKEGTIDPNQ